MVYDGRDGSYQFDENGNMIDAWPRTERKKTLIIDESFDMEDVDWKLAKEEEYDNFDKNQSMTQLHNNVTKNRNKLNVGFKKQWQGVI